MYLTLLADATCDLPTPVLARLEADTLPDRLEPEIEKNFFIDRLTDHWIYHSDSLQIVTPTSAYSPTYQTLRAASFTTQPELDQRRQQAHLTGHYRIRLFDSGQLYAGYGLVMHKALVLHREHRLSIDKLQPPLQAFSQTVRLMYSCPEPERLRQKRDPRAKKTAWLLRPFSSKNGCIYQLQNRKHEEVKRIPPEQSLDGVLTEALEALSNKTLAYPVVNTSYAGPLKDVQNHLLFQELHENVKRQSGHLWLSSMSSSAMAELGKGAFSVAFVV